MDTPTPVMSQEEFEQMIAAHTVRGWRLQSRTEFTATMTAGHRPNHVLHLLLTVITVGLWAPVWLLLSITNREQQLTLTRWQKKEVWLNKKERKQLGMS